MVRSRVEWLGIVLLLGLTAALLAACPTGDSETTCIPGESRLCHCSDGKAGSQVCAEDGKSLGQCECQGGGAKADGGVAPGPGPGQEPSVTPPVPPPVAPESMPPAPPPGSPIAAMASPFAADNATIGLWHFDEGSGSTTVDAGPHRLTSTLRSTTWTAGRFGGALMLSGSGSNMQIAANEGFFPTAAITIEAWIRPEAAGFMTVYDIQDTQGLSLRPRGSGVEVVFTLRINEVVRTLVSTEPVQLQQWHHVAGTFDGASMRLWIDGTIKGELAAPGTLTRAMQCETPTIGSNCTASGSWFNGGIDELRVSNMARYVVEGSEGTLTAQAGDAGPDADADTDAPVKHTKRKRRTLSDVAGDTARKALKTLGL